MFQDEPGQGQLSRHAHLCYSHLMQNIPDGTLMGRNASGELVPVLRAEHLAESSCTCGSGAHLRRCVMHPDNFDKHLAELQAENDELLTESERAEWRTFVGGVPQQTFVG